MITEIHLSFTHTQTNETKQCDCKQDTGMKIKRITMSARGKQSESFVKLNVYQLLSIRIKMCQQKERANLMYTNSMNETIFFSEFLHQE